MCSFDKPLEISILIVRQIVCCAIWAVDSAALSVGVEVGDTVALDGEDAGDGFEGLDGIVGGQQNESA